MNLRHVTKYAEILLHTSRATGKTTAVANAARSIDGILLCLTGSEAHRVAREHGCQVSSITSSPDSLRGIGKPILIDPSAAAALIFEAVRCAENLRDRVRGSFNTWVIKDPYPEISEYEREQSMLRQILGAFKKRKAPEISPHQAWRDGYEFAKNLVMKELAIE
jgi:hypothetical protein